MQERDRQAPLFTVRNAEGAMIAFAIIGFACLTTVFLHEIWLKGKSSIEAIYTIANNFPKIMSAATMLTFIEEGIDIMFQRLRDSLAKEKKIKEESEARGAAKVYKEISDWNTRRMEAEARNEPFTEPPPAPPQEPSK